MSAQSIDSCKGGAAECDTALSPVSPSHPPSQLCAQHRRGSSLRGTMGIAVPNETPSVLAGFSASGPSSHMDSRFLLPEVLSPGSSLLKSAMLLNSFEEGSLRRTPLTPFSNPSCPISPRSPSASPATEPQPQKLMASSFKERQRMTELNRQYLQKQKFAGLALENHMTKPAPPGVRMRVPIGTMSFASAGIREGKDSSPQLPGSGQVSQQKGDGGDDKAGTTDAGSFTPVLSQVAPLLAPMPCTQEQSGGFNSSGDASLAHFMRTPMVPALFKGSRLWSMTQSSPHCGSFLSTLRPFEGKVAACNSLGQLDNFSKAKSLPKLDSVRVEREPRRVSGEETETSSTTTPVNNAKDMSTPFGFEEPPRGGKLSVFAGSSPLTTAIDKAPHTPTRSPSSMSSLDRTFPPHHFKMGQLQRKYSSTSNSRGNSCVALRSITPPRATLSLVGKPGFSPRGGNCARVNDEAPSDPSQSATVLTPANRQGDQAESPFRVKDTATGLTLMQGVQGNVISAPTPVIDGTYRPHHEYLSELEKMDGTPSVNSMSHCNAHLAGTVGTSSGLERRDHEKMQKRPAAFFTSSSPPLSNDACRNFNKAVTDGFLSTAQAAYEGSSSSASASYTGPLEVSAGRPPSLHTFSTLAATRENKRKSSFSSLYFSMTKRHQMQRLTHTGNHQAQARLEEETTREVRGGDSGICEGLNADDDDDDSSKGFCRVGILETEEHVFIPRYELLPGGQTPMEIMLTSIRTTGAGGHSNCISGHDKEERWGGSDRCFNKLDKCSEQQESSEDVFTFGSISPEYTTNPTEEDTFVDCKVAARLSFDSEQGVMLISTKEEVGKYIGQTFSIGASDEADEEEQSRCTCSMQFITKDLRGVDYSNYHAHTLYHHCVYCKRRPASFLCLHCLRSTCPSHVTQHYRECEAECTLFLNLLDIMTSFDRIFWCEKCRCFTWKYTEAYDPLVDQLAITRGTYLQEAVRDISCVGYYVRLRRPQHWKLHSSHHMSLPRDPLCCSLGPSPKLLATGSLSTAVSPMHLPLDVVHERSINAASLAGGFDQASLLFTGAGSAGCGSPVARRMLRDGGDPLSQNEVLRVGGAMPKLVALGAKVQGWRATQEDAETAFVIDIPALSHKSSLEPSTTTAAAAPAVDGDEEAEGETPDTIAMAIFCVFDGHGGDAVAKLAASKFESHLREAVASARCDDVQARSLLFQLDFESSSPPFSTVEGSPVAARGNTFGCQVGNPDEDRNTGASKDDDGRDVVLGSEALRRHLETTTAGRLPLPFAPLPQFAAAEAVELPDGQAPMHPILDVGCMGESAAEAFLSNSGGWCCGTASPVVSRQEMEVLRVYFASIMEDALLSLDDDLRHSPEGVRGDYQTTGCTACVVGITANFILCANVGDSGAAVYTDHTIRRISVTHRITDPVEEARITAAGYTITGERIEGLLAVTRALGDYDFKQCGGKGPKEQAVIAVPDVTIMPVPFLEDNARLGVVAACDGVWDTATLHQVHHAIVNTPNDLDVAGSAMDAVIQASEIATALPRKESAARDGEDAAETVLLDAQLLTSAAGVFAQCVAPCDNDEGIGLDNCSLFLIERRWL
ncbi:putative protein phosphatase 2C [Trypanosoma rangeli]|uniref:protein-serine/threonine phosphatase n=1 Tax=Trypanosoma rangeli TaxID=5698 RepID=A0A422NZ44_TRYRA|nr:putative protein phosphatase 2C [Trypanosoma rangeli]RNF10747.1 putative protein phosphatase 2C [Trypanosoma rangeli]|eukprot:RNF10747.1 putative protein phosphatase 2C [Trypanosoma rangeli]